MRSSGLGALTVAAVGLALGCPATARAYVRYRSAAGNPYAWRPMSVPLSGYPQGITTMTADEMTNAMTQAVTSWTSQAPALSSCTYLTLPLSISSEVDTVPDSAYDHVNNITLRADAWETLCSPDPSGQSVCHDPSALAITSVYARSSGEIVDADIEVNAVNFRWADLVASPPVPGFQDLQNALTHETGHLLGLDHTCYIYAYGGADDPSHPRPNDQNGQPIPDCDNAPPDVVATTMFPSAAPGDVSKRTLEADDLQAICDIYPQPWTDRYASANLDGGSGCAVVPDGPVARHGGRSRSGLAAGMCALAALVAAARVRRRSRRGGPSTARPRAAKPRALA